MHELILPQGYRTAVGWNWTICRMLARSGQFVIKENSDREHIAVARAHCWTQLYLNGTAIGLDSWDTYAPTSGLHSLGEFACGGAMAHVKMILKLQYYDCPYWNRFEQETGIPVKPWTIMPSAGFPLEAFSWRPGAHTYIGMVTGRNDRFGRGRWVDWCRDTPDFIGTYMHELPIEDYLKTLQRCRWGIILKGKQRNHDGKNRRECEFSSCGMPLALNYEPTYDFPFVAGRDYVLLRTPADLAQLREIDPCPFAQASRELYARRLSPVGMSRELVRLVATYVWGQPPRLSCPISRSRYSPTDKELAWLLRWLTLRVADSQHILEFGAGPTSWVLANGCRPASHVIMENWPESIESVKNALPQAQVVTGTWRDIPADRRYGIVFVDSSAGFRNRKVVRQVRDRALAAVEHLLTDDALVIIHDWRTRSGADIRRYLESGNYRQIASFNGSDGVGIYRRCRGQ